MADADVLDIILRLSRLREFVAGTRTAAASVKEIGAAAKETDAASAIGGSKLAGAAGVFKQAGIAVGVAAAAAGYESTKMYISFQKQMEMIHTQANASQSEVARQSTNVLKLASSGKVSQGPQTLAEGLFHLESIGLRGARALHALKVAADGAAVGGANLEDTTTALGSAWLVNIKGAGNLRHTMALMNATVGAGNMKMQDLVTSLGTGVLPAAKLAGLNIKQVMGALAVLSDEGWKGSSAMAQLATSLHFLTDPTMKARDALSQLHLTQGDLVRMMAGPGGIQNTLKVLFAKMGSLSKAKRADILGDILPAGRGRVLEVLMNQLNRYQRKMRQIGSGTKNYGDDVAKTQQTASFKISAAWSKIQADMIRTGKVLAPVAVWFAQGVSKIADDLMKLPKWFKKVFGSIKESAGNSGTVISQVIKVLVGTFNSLKSSAVSLWHTAVQAWSSMKSSWDSVMGNANSAHGSGIGPDIVAIGKAFGWLARAIGNGVAFIAQKALPWFQTAFKGALYVVKGVIEIVAGVLTLNFGKALRGVWDIAKGLFLGITAGFSLVKKPIMTVVNIIKNLLVGAYKLLAKANHRVVEAIRSAWPKLKAILMKPFNAVKAVIIWIEQKIRDIAGKAGRVASTVASVVHAPGHLIDDINPFHHDSPSPASPPSTPRPTLPQATHPSPGPTAPPNLGADYAGSGLPSVIHNHIYIDGKEVSYSVGKNVSDKKARR